MPNPNPDQVGQYQSYPQAMKAIYAEVRARVRVRVRVRVRIRVRVRVRVRARAIYAEAGRRTF